MIGLIVKITQKNNKVMSTLGRFRKKLKLDKVWMAEQVAYERVALARQVVKERCEKDAEFAKDVLKAVGESLPQEIKEVAEATIAKDQAKENQAKMEEAKRLVEKWSKTRLLDGHDPDKLPIILESQEKTIFEEAKS